MLPLRQVNPEVNACEMPTPRRVNDDDCPNGFDVALSSQQEPLANSTRLSDLEDVEMAAGPSLPQTAPTPRAPVDGIHHRQLRRRRAAYPPLPSQIDRRESCLLHPFLESPTEYLQSPLNFAQPWADLEVLMAPAWDELATNPPLPSLGMWVCLLPWPVIVVTSDNRDYVTARDVIRTIWNALRHPLHPNSTRTNTGLMHRRHDEAVDQGKRAPLRLDLLRDVTTFNGLSHGGIDGDTWVLNLL
ncbi:hypothetical protein CPB85DRAFT_222629 [Mucidula mucida]|nr:hypothetical protein CPB85DRAFT_222629 [Mucidula mucida]